MFAPHRQFRTPNASRAGASGSPWLSAPCPAARKSNELSCPEVHAHYASTTAKYCQSTEHLALTRRSLMVTVGLLAPTCIVCPTTNAQSLIAQGAGPALDQQLDSATSATDFLSFTDPQGRFSLLVPAGWRQVQNLNPSFGVLASWYNPYEAGSETLAVYQKRVEAQTTRDIGTAKDAGLALAGVAANSQLQDYYDADVDGQLYYIAQVEFDGNTAGRFGAAIEFRNVTVDKGLQYTLRITTTRYRWLAYDMVRKELRPVVNSFRIKV